MEEPHTFFIDSITGWPLKKSLYSWKQAIHAWIENRDSLFLNIGFKVCEYDIIIYVLHVHCDNFIVALYVHNLVIT